MLACFISGRTVLRSEVPHSISSRQYRATVHVEDLSGNKSRMLAYTERESARRFPPAWPRVPSEWWRKSHPARLGIIQRRHRHIGIDPSGRHAIHVDASRGQFGRKAFDHADQRALGRGVVDSEKLRRAVRRWNSRARCVLPRRLHLLLLHLGDECLTRAEDTVEVDGHRVRAIACQSSDQREHPRGHMP